VHAGPSCPETFVCCGVIVRAGTVREAVRDLLTLVRSELGGAVHLCNAFTLSLASRDPSYRKTLNRGVNFCDGAPVATYARYIRRCSAMRGPVRGPSLLTAVLTDPACANLRHYFYGGSEEVLAAVTRRIAKDYPALQVCGAESPPYRNLSQSELTAALERIVACKPDIVWVGLGTPRQDVFADVVASETGIVAIGIGAAFNFFAGSVPEAPRILHGSGFEWGYRLLREPRRLWRRYTIDSFWFIVGLFRSYP
jgi:N-acetylglucosaminyldiphosphoundecaprenol N-acetyl-beta-D-mannosaminyltransferase